MNLPSRTNSDLSSKVPLMFFHWREHTKVSLEPFSVVVLNEILYHGDQACSIGKAIPIIPLPLQDSPESFHRSVINALGNSGHTLSHASFGQHMVKRTASILEASV